MPLHQSIDPKLAASLKRMLPEFDPPKALVPNGVKRLRRGVRISLMRIRSYYKQIIGYNRLCTADQWISDQFNTVAAASENSRRSLKGICLPSHGELPDFFVFLRRALAFPGFHFTDESLRELIGLFEQGRPLTNAEHDFIVPLIHAACVTLIAQALQTENISGHTEQIERCAQTLFETGNLDLRKLNEESNRLEQELRRDPTGVYARQDERTRALYRYKVAKVAEWSGCGEITLAKRLLESARKESKHVGFAIFDYYDQMKPKNSCRTIYLRLLFFLPFIVSVLLSGLLGNILWAILFYFPCYEILRPMVERIAARKSEITYAPRLEFDGVVPRDCQTLVVISTLLPEADELSVLERKLEKLYLSNPDGAVGFCVLADLKASNRPVEDGDKKAVSAVKKRIQALNNRWGSHFVLLVRERKYSKTQQRYTGWERKRGAITDLVALIHGKPLPVAELYGNVGLIYGTRYLLALDYDTELTIDSVSELVSVAAHPMNRPVIDGECGIVKRGYGIIVPRVTAELKSTMRTRFARALSGVGGTACYDQACGEFYQDVYGESIFTGKGLIDVEAYQKLMPDLFEEETVLSHDILEGGFLRTLFVGDVQVSDSVPADGISFFKRLHRWGRGDAQNAQFILPVVRLFHGRFENPLNRLNRFHIFDNLRRALLPMFITTCLLAAWVVPGERQAILLVLAALSAAAPYFYSLWRVVISGSLTAFFTRFYAAVLPQSIELLQHAAMSILLLPQFTIQQTDAFVRGLYRRYVSKRNMLEWTPAAQVEAGKNTLLGVLRFYSPQWVVGIVLLFGPWALKMVGLLFLSAIPLTVWMGKEKAPEVISSEIAERMRLDVKRMLAFYEDYAGESERYLPPDNMQTAPVVRVAHRTSPTNIGLMLLSYLTACDLGLWTVDELYIRVERVITTVEGMEKFYGNLYNWYDTVTLKILPPGFVSTVDSGNLLCSLVALKEGLLEYAPAKKEIRSLIERIELLIDGTDLAVFYDARRKLISVGWDSVNCALSSSHYDMLMSEARMTSYFAIARRQVPACHWAALSRAMSRSGLHAGFVSWTGTMFEYFMPELLLHCVEGSAGYEALNYCISCQKKCTKRLKVPWGISESGIYAFDSQLNYQYSPNGVQKLARKRGMDDELVVSPYSSYLTLEFDTTAAYENLIRLEQMGTYGKYGFYEAVDFTRSRTGGADYQIIRSYMAHHIGMSIVAIGNLLCENRMQKRFLRDARMASAEGLLSEKITVGEFVLTNFFRKKREPSPREEENFEFVGHLFPQQPRVKLLSNTELSDVLTDVGASYLRTGRIDVTRRPVDLLENAVGIFSFARVNGETVSLTFAPGYQENSYETAFAPAAVRYTVKANGFAAKTEVRIHRSIPCEQRRITIQNQGNAEQDISLIFYWEPSLFPHEDDYAHKSFSKLFVSIEQDVASHSIVASRRRRGKEETRVLAVGFREDVEYDCITSREELFSRPDVSTIKPSAFTDEFNSDSTGIPDPCIALRLKIHLARGESRTLTLLTSVGNSRADAVAQIAAVRRDPPLDIQTAAPPQFVSGSLEHRIAQTILPQILFHKRDSAAQQNAVAQNRLAPVELWGVGVSADFPITVCDLYSKTDTERISAYAACHSLLRLAFVEFDLVFLYEGGAEMGEVVQQEVLKHCPADIIGARAGIHLINKAALSPERLNLLYAAACHIATRSLVRIESPVQAYVPLRLHPSSPAPFTAKAELMVSGGSFAKEHGLDSFFVTGTPKLPWCHILANPTFGTLLSDKALGFTWAVNSRQCKLTPWYNDAMHDNVGERILLRTGTGCFDLVNGSLPEFNPGYAAYRAINEDIYSEAKVTVPAKGMIKYLDITLRNDSTAEREVLLCYYTEPCLDVTRDHARQLLGERTEDALVLHNPFNHSLHTYMALSANGEEFTYTCDRPAFLCGRWGGNTPPPFQDPCAALIISRMLEPGQTETVRFALAFSTTKKGALALLRIQPRERYHTSNSLKVNSGDPAVDVLVNTWLPWQTAASRLFGRTGFYQNGGAYGFRDQLQDVCSYLLLSPELARSHILRCAAVQFEEGDVLHWWHTLPQDGGKKRGVRTRYSDDLVWLPYAVCEYVERTGDDSILSVNLPYLTAPELNDGQKDCYLEAVSSQQRESLYHHCQRALERAWNLGGHGLPKIGGGDWNDGYSKVGIEGKGESVWLAQFLALTLKRFSVLSQGIGEKEIAECSAKRAGELLAAVDREAWDGRYYLRAFYDNGEKMGSHENDECRIDSLPQSFAVLSGMPDTERVSSAMNTAFDELVDRKKGIIRLFTPAFADSKQDPGYVKAYPPGVRENGGQYTHAAVWLAMAAGRAGMEDKFFCLTNLLNPVKRCQPPGALEEYALEPYWMAADIYTDPHAYGRGGWSMYTGAAGWYYRLLTEELLGLRLESGRLNIHPRLPDRMLGLTMELRIFGTRLHITVNQNPALDGEEETILLDGGEKSITIG